MNPIQLADHRRALVLRRLRAGPATVAQIHKTVDVHPATISGYLLHFERDGKVRHTTVKVRGANGASRNERIFHIGRGASTEKRSGNCASPSRSIVTAWEPGSARDPLALPPGFFKPTSLGGEILPRAVAAPVAPSRFPAPSNFTFEVPV